MKKINIKKETKNKILSAIKFILFVIVVITILKVSPLISKWLQMLEEQTLTNYITGLLTILFGTILLFPFFEEEKNNGKKE